MKLPITKGQAEFGRENLAPFMELQGLCAPTNFLNASRICRKQSGLAFLRHQEMGLIVKLASYPLKATRMCLSEDGGFLNFREQMHNSDLSAAEGACHGWDVIRAQYPFFSVQSALGSLAYVLDYDQSLVKKQLKEFNFTNYTDLCVSSRYCGFKAKTVPSSWTEKYNMSRQAFEWIELIAKKTKYGQFARKAQAHIPEQPIVLVKVGLRELVKRIEEAQALWVFTTINAHLGIKGQNIWSIISPDLVKFTVSQYGGARTDRLASRNHLMNQISNRLVSGSRFHSLDSLDGNSGMFMADVIRSYGPKNSYLVVIGNELLCLSHDESKADRDPTLGYGELRPAILKMADYRKVLPVVQKRLSSCEAAYERHW